MKLATYMEWSETGDADMARRIGACSQHSVKKWRLGSRVPRTRIMLRIREVTDGQVTPDDFFPSVPSRELSRAAPSGGSGEEGAATIAPEAVFPGRLS